MNEGSGAQLSFGGHVSFFRLQGLGVQVMMSQTGGSPRKHELLPQYLGLTNFHLISGFLTEVSERLPV